MKIMYLADDGKAFGALEDAQDYEDSLEKDSIVEELKKILPSLHELHIGMIVDNKDAVIKILLDEDLTDILVQDSQSRYCRDCRHEWKGWDDNPCNTCQVKRIKYPSNFVRKED